MVGRTRLSAFQGINGLTPVQATGTPTAPAAFPFNGLTATGVAAPGTFYNIVDIFGNVIVTGTAAVAAAAVNYRNFVRYCEFPGNRLYDLVKFDVNGNPLDQYHTFIPMMLEKFCTPPNKRVGHDRLVGQEVPLIGYGGIAGYAVTDADAADTPTGITKFASNQSNQTVGLYNAALTQVIPNINGISSTLTATAPLNADYNGSAPFAGPMLDISRKLLQIVNGPQTPKPIQPPLEIWNKLR